MEVSSHSSTSHSLFSLFKNSPKLLSILCFSWVSATSLDICLSWIRDLWLDPCGGSSPVIFTSHGPFSQQGKRMHSASPIKQKFLKKWIMGLQLCNSSKKNMTIMERRKAIKLSADLALASVRNCTTRWSRALIAGASQNDDNKALLQHIIGSDAAKLKKASSDAVANSPTSLSKKIASKKILKRSWGIRRVRKLTNGVLKDRPNSIAKRLVKKRTQLLKNLVPGGESMDAISLIEETLDYMVWLRAQVDVMRSLARASELLDGK